MSSINRRFLFDHLRGALFGGRFRQAQVDGISAFLDKWEGDMPDADDRWLAYMLATAHHETGQKMQPVREAFGASDDDTIRRLDRAFGSGALHVSKPYWRRDAEGKAWFGRGFVQITHKANYQRVGDALGIDLVSDPSVALELKIAVDILFKGMIDGLFTNRRLDQFFVGDRSDWRNARRIVNGLDRADNIAEYGRHYYAAISYTVG